MEILLIDITLTFVLFAAASMQSFNPNTHNRKFKENRPYLIAFLR